MADSLIGKTLGKYQIVELIGRGAMAEVYKAYQASLDRHVAIKLLHSFLAEDKNFLARFQREAKSGAQLRHPNIVQTYDFDATDGVYFYIVMECINGYTLDAKLQELTAQNEIMPLPEAIRISKDVASALSYANSHGMAHRDIKPSNVMLNQDRHVILTDFGIAKILGDARHTATGIVGTPNYISPEQGLGKAADARSDLYSLGAMFFQMVTGQLPYQADVAVASSSTSMTRYLSPARSIRLCRRRLTPSSLKRWPKIPMTVIKVLPSSSHTWSRSRPPCLAQAPAGPRCLFPQNRRRLFSFPPRRNFPHLPQPCPAQSRCHPTACRYRRRPAPFSAGHDPAFRLAGGCSFARFRPSGPGRGGADNIHPHQQRPRPLDGAHPLPGVVAHRFAGAVSSARRRKPSARGAGRLADSRAGRCNA